MIEFKIVRNDLNDTITRVKQRRVSMLEDSSFMLRIYNASMRVSGLTINNRWLSAVKTTRVSDYEGSITREQALKIADQIIKDNS